MSWARLHKMAADAEAGAPLNPDAVSAAATSALRSLVMMRTAWGLPSLEPLWAYRPGLDMRDALTSAVAYNRQIDVSPFCRDVACFAYTQLRDLADSAFAAQQRAVAAKSEQHATASSWPA